MRYFVILLIAFSVGTCATRKGTKKITGKPNSTLISPEGPCPTSLHLDCGVPKSLPTPQPTMTKDFATLSFRDVEGFDAAAITIKLPADVEIPLDEFNVRYKACPKFPDKKLPKELTQCIEGYNRNLQFVIPIFTNTYSLDLFLCDDSQCYEKTDFNATNVRPLSSKSTPKQMDIASAQVKVETDKQEIYKAVGILYDKLQTLSKFLDSCQSPLNKDQVAALQGLAKLSRKSLEDQFLYQDLATLKPLLSSDFAVVNKTALDYTKDAIGYATTLNGILTGLIFIGGAATAVVFFIKDNVELHKFYEMVEKHREVEIDNKKFTLVKDELTGFLVDPDLVKRNPSRTDGEWKYYLEDPDSKEVIRHFHDGGAHTWDDPRDAGKARKFDFVTIDPFTFNNGEGLKPGIKYEDGHFYAHEYNDDLIKGKIEGKYVFEDNTGQILDYDTWKGKIRTRLDYHVWGEAYFKEYGIKRFEFDKVNNKADYMRPKFEDSTVKVENFVTRKELSGRLVDMDAYLAKSKALQHRGHPSYDAHEGIKGAYNYTKTHLKPLLAAGLGTITMILAITQSVNLLTQSFKLADSKDANTDKNICSKVPDLKPELTEIADNRTLITIWQMQLADKMGFNVQITDTPK